MSKRRPPPAKAVAPTRKVAEIPLPYRTPVHVDLAIDVHKKWFDMVKKAEVLVQDDADLQRKAAKGLQIKERRMPVEVLGRLYAQYCDLINKMYDTYLTNVQLQRAKYIQEIISILMKRMFELRNELVHYVVNDYIFVDKSLKQLFKTPYDIQIVVPYHYAVDSRPGSVEEVLQKMWKAAEKRGIKASKPKKIKVIRSPVNSDTTIGLKEPKPQDEQEDGEDREERIEIQEVEEEVEEEEEEIYIDPKAHSEDYLKCVFIQKHERYRKYFLRDFIKKSNERRKYFQRKDVVPPPPELQHKAASLIQEFYRRFMAAKREHLRNYKRDVILGIVPDFDHATISLREANEKLYERRLQTRKRIEVKYLEQIEKERTRLLYCSKREELIEDITKEVIEWFSEWYYGYDFFPQFPYELEGGTLLVVRGQYPTIDEQKEDDERYRKATMGKTKDQLAEEKKERKREEEEKKEMAREKAKKEKEAYFKAKCNPVSDVGYTVRMSQFNDALTEVLQKYRAAWSIYDQWPLESCGEVIYGFMKPMITEDVMEKMHLECRKFVDEMMRLELKVFVKAQQLMFQRVSKLWPKLRKRPRKRPPKIPIPFAVDDAMLKSVEKVFDLDIMSKPTTKLDAIMGDISLRAYECSIADPNATFPNPGFADVKRRLVLSCVFGSGLDPEAPRNRAVMLMGLENNCKSFLVDCVAGEMGAVKFDISPEVFSSKVKKLNKMLQLVILASRIFQPSVIFLRDIDRVFIKKVPPEQKTLKATKMKGPLKKLLKTIPLTDKVIFIATCSNPLLTKTRPMMKMFNEVIIVPKPDYGSLQKYLYDRFQGIRSMPRDYNVSALAKCMQGIGFGKIIEIFDAVMTPERICKLNYVPLNPGEFIEYMIINGIESVDPKEYQKMVDLWVKFSPLKAERADYKIINEKRAYGFARLAKIQADKEEKAAKKAAAKAAK